jgi:hypothetical protein
MLVVSEIPVTINPKEGGGCGEAGDFGEKCGGEFTMVRSPESVGYFENVGE